MSDPSAIKRQLKIKTGVVQRLTKEHTLYQKETVQQKQKLDKFVADGAEDWDIKNATRMLEESNKMINDTATRLGKAAGELRDLVIAARMNKGVSESEELMKAEELMEETAA